MEVMTLLRKMKQDIDSHLEFDYHDSDDSKDNEDNDDGDDDDLSYQYKYITDMIKFKKPHRQVQIGDDNEEEWDFYEKCHNAKYMHRVDVLQKCMERVRKKAKKAGALLLESTDDIDLFPRDDDEEELEELEREVERGFACNFQLDEIETIFAPLIPTQKNETVTETETITALDNTSEGDLNKTIQNESLQLSSTGKNENKTREEKLLELITPESYLVVNSNNNQNDENNSNNHTDVANEVEQKAQNTITVTFSFQSLVKDEPEMKDILRQPQYSKINDIKIQPTFINGSDNNDFNDNDQKPKYSTVVFFGEPDLKRYIHDLKMIYPWSTMIEPSRCTELIEEIKLMIPDKKPKKKKRNKKKNKNDRNSNNNHHNIHRNLTQYAKDFYSERRIKMNFVRVENDDSIIMKIVDKEYTIKFEQLQQKMNLYYSVFVKKLDKERIKLEDVQRGLVVACCISIEHGMFVRTKILSWIDEEEEESDYFVLVQSVDDEKSYKVRVENLFYLHDEFLDLPFLVNGYHLSGHEFFTGTGLVYEYIEEIIDTKTELYGDVTTTRENGRNIPKLVTNLFIGTGSNPQKDNLTNVNHQLLHFILETLKQTVPDDNMEQGFLSRWSSDGTFWLHKKNRILDKVLYHFLNSDNTIFKDLKQETLSSISEDFIKDQMYVARRLEDNHFYRGKILEIYYAENSVLIDFVDLGVSEVMDLKITSIYNVKQIDITLEVIPNQHFKQYIPGWKQGSLKTSVPFKKKIPIFMQTKVRRDSNGFITSSLCISMDMDVGNSTGISKIIPMEKYFE